GGGDRLEVAHLADEDDVGILAQHVLEGGGEGVRVLADLPLVDHRPLVVVEELDRVLDRHDVDGFRRVDQVDEAGQRGALARAGGAGDEHQAPLEGGEVGHGVGQAQGPEGDDLVGDDPHDGADAVALAQDVDAKASDAGDGVGRVELEVVLEALPLLLGDDGVEQLPDGGAVEDGVFGQRRQLPPKADDRVAAGGQVEVRAAEGDDPAEDVVDVE